VEADLEEVTDVLALSALDFPCTALLRPMLLQQSYPHIMKPVPWRGRNDRRRRRTKARWRTEAGIELNALNLWESKIAQPMESNTTRLPEEQVNGIQVLNAWKFIGSNDFCQRSSSPSMLQCRPS